MFLSNVGHELLPIDEGEHAGYGLFVIVYLLNFYKSPHPIVSRFTPETHQDWWDISVVARARSVAKSKRLPPRLLANHKRSPKMLREFTVPSEDDKFLKLKPRTDGTIGHSILSKRCPNSIGRPMDFLYDWEVVGCLVDVVRRLPPLGYPFTDIFPVNQ
ncbi:hypothetical protein E1B28_013445 [Marasmius oreades]|uniref:Uncharacterized protein n=1 Tax=Marasmius oreades TaxID=181124 RepID=A0A9P7UM70_9AGAR|nr:uncharacterized protein E1B28_013445 [Marasmius oreades]KAG7087482.1 hypothetical protein E1B28_013445 [Marasmius oreades]